MYLKTLVVLLFVFAVPAAQPKKINVGFLASYSFTTPAGASLKLNLAQHKATVLVFISPSCPICQKYTGIIEQIYNNYKSNDIAFYGVFPTSLGQKPAIASFEKDYGITFPLLLDNRDKLLKLCGASITPEVLLIDKSGTVLYQGKIDNWYIDLGKKRGVVTEHYLIAALDALLAGKKIALAYTAPVGCFINEAQKK